MLSWWCLHLCVRFILFLCTEVSLGLHALDNTYGIPASMVTESFNWEHMLFGINALSYVQIRPHFGCTASKLKLIVNVMYDQLARCVCDVKTHDHGFGSKPPVGDLNLSSIMASSPKATISQPTHFVIQRCDYDELPDVAKSEVFLLRTNTSMTNININFSFFLMCIWYYFDQDD